MNLIVYSGSENFKEGAEKIKNDTLQLNKKCEILELKSLIKIANIDNKFNCIYFLSSNENITKICNKIKDGNCKIINKNFLLNNINTSKYDSMQKVFNYGVCIPKNYEPKLYTKKFSEHENNSIYIKSKNPRGLVRQIHNKNTIEKILNQISEPSSGNYYIEEDVSNRNYLELKLYYVNNKIFPMNNSFNENQVDWLLPIMSKISKSTGLEVFSADFFVNLIDQKYYCIDINHASSFFKSDLARNEFIKKILK